MSGIALPDIPCWAAPHTRDFCFFCRYSSQHLILSLLRFLDVSKHVYHSLSVHAQSVRPSNLAKYLILSSLSQFVVIVIIAIIVVVKVKQRQGKGQNQFKIVHRLKSRRHDSYYPKTSPSSCCFVTMVMNDHNAAERIGKFPLRLSVYPGEVYY